MLNKARDEGSFPEMSQAETFEEAEIATQTVAYSGLQ